MIKDFTELCEEVKASLDEYLSLMGVEPNQSGFFTCLNPAHNDGSPSMHVTPDGERVKCFGCGAMYDTIDLAALRAGLVAEGEEFVDALKLAADQLGIAYSLNPPTAEEIRNATFYNAYQVAAAAVADPEVDSDACSESTKAHIADREWNVETLKELGIGCLSTATLRGLPGLVPTDIASPDEWLQKYDFKRNGRSSVFGQDRLIFTLYDDKGKPVGFTARYTGSEEGYPKYCNTSTTLVPIFDKKAQLYLYHLAKREIRTQVLDKLYVFEGQPDVVTAHHHGIKNCTALGTSSITERQVYLLKKSGATKVVFCLDGDEAGKQGAVKLLAERLKEFIGVRIYVKEMPDGLDPDEYLRKHSREDFEQVPEELGIEWLLNYYKDSMESEELAEFMVPMIASFASAIEREGLAKRVALITDLSTSTILDDVNAIVHQKENTVKNKIREIGEDLSYQLQKNPERATQILDVARESIICIEAEHETDHLSGDFFADNLLRFREESEAHDAGFPGFNMPMMPGFQAAFDNDWSDGKMICIGGDENTGKTSFSCFKMANLVLPEAENNLRGIYMTIDDSVQELYHKFVCIFAKHFTKGYRGYTRGFDLEINHVVRPKYWAKVMRDIDPQIEKDMFHAYKVGYEKLIQFARSERLVMIGVPNSRNLPDFRRAINRMRENHPNDNVYAYLDNIHKLPLPNGDARIGFKEISNDIKDYSVEFNCAVGGTLEYNTDTNKRGKDGRPTNNSLAESRAFRYDASALVHMYNQLHVKGEESHFYHHITHPWYQDSLKAPVVEAIIGKNKISSNKMPHFFKFYPGSSWFEYQDRAEALADAHEKEEAAKSEAEKNKHDKDIPVFDRTAFGQQDAIRIA